VHQIEENHLVEEPNPAHKEQDAVYKPVYKEWRRALHLVEDHQLPDIDEDRRQLSEPRQLRDTAEQALEVDPQEYPEEAEPLHLLRLS